MTKVTGLVVILRMLICWGVAITWSLLLLLKIAGGSGVCHVLHEVHSLCVVLNYVLSLRRVCALQRRLFFIFSVTLGRRVERRRLQSKHVVVWPLVSKVYLVRESDGFVLNWLRFCWCLLVEVE